MSDLISPISYSVTKLLDISFEINPTFVASRDDLSAGVRNEMSVAHEARHKRDAKKVICKCIMEADIDIRQSDDSDVEVKDVATFSCTMSAQGSSPIDLYDDESLSEKVLEANLITLIWGKMRSFLELLSVDSFIGRRISLPALDPYALIEKDKEDDANPEDGELGPSES